MVPIKKYKCLMFFFDYRQDYAPVRTNISQLSNGIRVVSRNTHDPICNIGVSFFYYFNFIHKTKQNKTKHNNPNENFNIKMKLKQNKNNNISYLSMLVVDIAVKIHQELVIFLKQQV